MYVKIHITGNRTITAICDEELINKTFSQGKLILEITERFYKGEIMKEDKVLELMNNATNLNIVGKKAIKLAIKNNIINKENVILIQNIPHAQVYQI